MQYIFSEFISNNIDTFRVPIKLGHHLDIICIQQSNVAHFSENYAILYFDTKHLGKRLNMG